MQLRVLLCMQQRPYLKVVWAFVVSASSILMFTMGRLDVWPVGDLAVRRGWQIAHGLKEMPNEKQMEPLGDPFSPYRSIAAWYCWRVLEPQEPW